jgi:hypothetical protein
MVRNITGAVAPDKIPDPETRRCVQNILQRVQWILDNWPGTSKPYAFVYSVREYGGTVQLVNDAAPVKARRYYGHDESGALGWFLVPDDVTFDMSVVNNSGIVTLKNDAQDPDFGYVYGVGTDGQKGWVDLVDHPWRFKQTNETGGDLTNGLVRIAGADTAHGMPSSLSGITTSTSYWITVDTDAKTATWASGAYASGFPTGSSTQLVYPILSLVCNATTGVIDFIEQRRFSDIAVLEPGTEDDPTEPDYPMVIDDTTTADITKGWMFGQIGPSLNVQGLKFTFHTLPEYSESDQKWYSYVRTLTIAANGKVFSLTTAARVTVHEPINHAVL